MLPEVITEEKQERNEITEELLDALVVLLVLTMNAMEATPPRETLAMNYAETGLT